MRKDLQIVEISGANLPAPRGDVVVAHQEHAKLTFTGFHAGVELPIRDLESGRNFLGNDLIIEAIELTVFAF